MLLQTWLKSFGTWMTGTQPRRQTRGARLPSNLAQEIRTMEARVLLTATAPDALENAPAFDPASASLWQTVESFPQTAARGVNDLHLADYTPLVLNESAVRQTLDRAPDEAKFNFSVNTSNFTLADPEGHLERFAIFETSVMAPELAAQFPEIKTYSGRGIDDPTATVQLDLTPQGFHAQVLSANGRWYVDPYSQANHDYYASYFSKDAIASSETKAKLQSDLPPLADVVQSANASAANASSGETPHVAARTGTQLRTYRTAVAADGEYTAFHGGTVPLAQAAIVTAINRVSGIYENELSIRLQLVANNSSLIYTNAATDPYTNTDPNALLTQNQTNIDSVIGSSNYDIGHVFTTGGGGLAGLGVVGNNSNKAWGETGLGSPTGDTFYVDYVAHEMGHQFGANHTFNVSDGNRNAGTAYEPGSGSTIMGYAGLFGADDLQAHSDAYFHSVSFDEIINYVDNVIPLVGTRTSTGNTVPTVNAGADYTIPASTPFKLTATGNDSNGDTLTYNWEERDLGAALSLAAADNGTSPLFRSFSPTTDPSRTFLNQTDLISNTTTRGEKLPTTTRDLNFRATVRDNRAGGGGVNTDDMVVHVVNTGAAFAVTSPNTNISWNGGTTQTVTWNVAGTNANGINVANVRILLSTDGGNTFGTELTASTPNDGSADIVVPNVNTTQARIKVEAIGNVFFDFSNANFSIAASANQSPVINNQTFSVAENSSNDASVGTVSASDPDGGQSLTYAITAGNDSGAFAINSTTGAITVANGSQLNYEATNNYALTVQVTDNGTPAASASATVTVNVTNVNEAPTAVFLNDGPNYGFDENASTASDVLLSQILVSDDALGTNTFSITGTDASVFKIVGNNLYLKAGTVLNYEAKSLFVANLNVDDATVGGTPDATFAFDVFLRDVNEFNPVVQSRQFLIGENSVNGAMIGTIASTDDDTSQTRTFAITAGNTNNAFAINPNTGMLTVNNSAALDYEAIQQFNLTITVTDSGSPARTGSAATTVFLADRNDAPKVTPQNFMIGENSINGAFIGTIASSDQDAGQTRTYSISAGNVNNAFVINPNTGVLSVNSAAALNYETNQQFNLTIRVVDNGDPAAAGTAPVIVFLKDVNEFTPVVQSQQFLIGENSVNGAFIGMINATDGDTAQTRTFAITAGNTNNAFAINPTTGALSVNNSAALNYEAVQQFNLTVTATDNGSPTRAGSATVTVFLADRNDAPVVTPQNFLISENSVNGAFMGTIAATDQDAGQTRTFSIVAGNTDNAFAINPTTGVLTVNNSAALNYEAVQQFNLTVRATDNGSPAAAGTAPVIVYLRDVNEAPVVAATQFQLLENTPNGAYIGPIASTDPDAGQTKTYSIVSGNTNNAFAINPTTGVLTVNNRFALDYETTPVFNLIVRVTDNGNPALSGQNAVTVYLRDVVGAKPAGATPILGHDTTTVVLPTVKKSGLRSLSDFLKRST